MKTGIIFLAMLAVLLCGCSTQPVIEDANTQHSPNRTEKTRESSLPDDVIKQTQKTDKHPPILHSDEFSEPIPISAQINTKGAEDSPFIMPDGKTLYFFFTPDVRIPPNEQLSDGVTGIWITHKENDSWSTPKRVWLQQPDKLALDGAPFADKNQLWFASAREGYKGLNIFTAEISDNEYTDIKYIGDKLMKTYMLGELHLNQGEMYYHANRPDGKGDLDIWTTKKSNGDWLEPQNLEGVNTKGSDGFPFVSSDGNELWITRVYMGTPALYRSKKKDGIWQEPELIVSQFAGEATLDDEGNLYFTHHYYENDVMLESDIYVAYKK
jgi:hypothetical protein